MVFSKDIWQENGKSGGKMTNLPVKWQIWWENGALAEIGERTEFLKKCFYVKLGQISSFSTGTLDLPTNSNLLDILFCDFFQNS